MEDGHRYLLAGPIMSYEPFRPFRPFRKNGSKVNNLECQKQNVYGAFGPLSRMFGAHMGYGAAAKLPRYMYYCSSSDK